MELHADEFSFVRHYVELIIEKAYASVNFGYRTSSKTFLFGDDVKEDDVGARSFASHKCSVAMSMKNSLKVSRTPYVIQSKSLVSEQHQPLVKLVHYEKGKAVFVDALGKLVTADGEKYVFHNREVPGSPYEIAKIRFNISKLPQVPFRPSPIPSPVRRGGCEAEVRRAVELPPIRTFEKRGLFFVNGKALRTRVSVGQIHRNTAAAPGKHTELGTFSRLCPTPPAFTDIAGRYMLADYGDRQRAAVPAMVLRATPVEETIDIFDDPPTPPRRVNKPQKTGIKTFKKSHPPRSFAEKGMVVSRVLNLDSLDRPGVKVRRPVRGFRVWGLLPPRKFSVSLKGNRSSLQMMLESDREQKERGEKSRLAFHEPLQLVHSDNGHNKPPRCQRENSPMRAADGNPESTPRRKAASLGTVSVPKTGRIKLTALSYELEDPEYFDDRRIAAERRDAMIRQYEQFMGPALPSPSPDWSRHNLIRNKTILKQVKSDMQRLEQEKRVAEQFEQLMEGDGLESLLTHVLAYQMEEVPNINSYFQNFLKVHKTPPEDKNGRKGNCFQKVTDKGQTGDNSEKTKRQIARHKSADASEATNYLQHDKNKSAKQLTSSKNNGAHSAPNTPRSLLDVYSYAGAIDSDSAISITSRKTFDNLLQQTTNATTSNSTDHGRSGDPAPLSCPSSRLWHAVAFDPKYLGSDPATCDRKPYSPASDERAMERLSLHHVIRNAQKITQEAVSHQ